ncbi:MAG: MFS transporter [Candidatus Choladocola sp.]|nr:MFS transporter [Candidatus Choladocola sp.]
MEKKNNFYFPMISVLFFSYAVGTSVLGTFMIDLLNDFGLGVSDGGIFSVLYYTGCLLGVVISSFLLKYLKNSTWIVITYGIYVFGMIAVGNTDTLTAYLILLLIIGSATKFLDLAINTEISVCYEKNKGFYINILHGCFGAGSFIGPLFAARFLGFLPKWQWIYGFIGCICGMLLIVFMITGKKVEVEKSGTRQNGMNFAILKKSEILCLILALFFYCGHQSGISTWVPLFLRYQYDAGSFLASCGVSVFWICLVISRISCAKLSVWFGEETILTVGMVLAIIFHLSGVLVPNILFAILGYGGAGLFAGAAIPLILTIGYRECPENQGTVSVILFLSISAGQIVFPWIMGIICGNLGLTFGMLSNVFCLVGTSVFVMAFRAIKKQRRFAG